MKVEELRIGNKIGFYKPLINELQIGTIRGILFDDDEGILVFVPEFSKKTWLNIEAIKQLDLTEEWLLKLGFYKSSGENPHFTKGNTLLIFKTNYESESIEDYYHFEFGITKSFGAIREIRLNYVHQLQNLASDLNEELVLQD